MFQLITGQLPTSKTVIEKNLHIFLERNKIFQADKLIFDVGKKNVIYDMNGKLIDETDVIINKIIITSDEFKQITDLVPQHKADIEVHAHKFLSKITNDILILQFILANGNYVNISVDRIKKMEEYRNNNPEQWRRFIEFDESGNGEAKMWSISLVKLNEIKNSKYKSFYDYCISRGTIIGDNILLPDRQFSKLKSIFPKLINMSKISFPKNEKNPIPEKVIDERLIICEACDKWSNKKNRCKLACCGHPFRIADADYQCLHPNGPRWLTYKSESFKITKEISDLLDQLIENVNLREQLLNIVPILSSQLQSYIQNPSCGICRYTLAKALSKNPDIFSQLV